METNKVISNENCEEPRSAVVTCSNSFDEFSWVFVYLNNTFQCSIRDLTSKHASLKQADREINMVKGLLDTTDDTIKLLENFKQQYLNDEKGSLNHKRVSDQSANRDSGISSARGSFPISQFANVQEKRDNTCLKSPVDPDLIPSLRPKPVDVKDTPKRKGMVFESGDRDFETDGTLDCQQQSLVRNNMPELYQLFTTNTKENKKCYQFVPFENVSVAALPKTCLSSFDEKSERDKKLPKSSVLGSKPDREAVCMQWQTTNETTGIKLRMASSDCNLSSSRNDSNADRRPFDRETRTEEEITFLQTTTRYAKMDEKTKFYLGQQAANDNCDHTAEMYCPSFASANFHKVNLLKSLSSKSLPSKLDKISVEFDLHRSESTTSLTSRDIAERYRLEVQLSENTFALYELQLTDTDVDNTARKHIAGDPDQSKYVGTEKDAAAENHDINMKEEKEEITETLKLDPLNDLSKHSNEENNGQSLSTLDSDNPCDFLRLRLVKKS